jgi:hypothetical protein
LKDFVHIEKIVEKETRNQANASGLSQANSKSLSHLQQSQEKTTDLLSRN